MRGVARVAVTKAEKCAETKQKSAAKKLSAKLRCYANAAKKGTGVDPACLAKAETTFTQAFAKAEAAGGCVNTDDAARIETGVDTFVSHE